MIFFDLDGTLFRTHETTIPAFRALCAEFGIPLTAEGEKHLLITTSDAFLNKAAPGLPKEERERFKQRLHELEHAEIDRCGRLFDGVYELLCELKDDGHALGISSMSRQKYVEHVLRRCGISELFNTKLGRTEGKTKGEVLREYITDESLYADDCLFVGDSITDLTAANENGMPFLGVSYGYGAEQIAGKCVMADSAAELCGVIYRILIYMRLEKAVNALPHPTVIGINGVDTSGKTEFSEGFAAYLRRRGHSVQLLHVDDFHKPSFVRHADMSPEGCIRSAFDLSRLSGLLREISLAAVSRKILVLDPDTDAYTKKLQIETSKDTVVIVEGTLLFRPPIDELITLRVFLDVGFDEVLRRARIRDVPIFGEAVLEKYGTRYIPAQKLYFECCSPRERCDILIDNNDYNHPKLLGAGNNKEKG